MEKVSNAGRITRADQAWGPAHREYEERQKGGALVPAAQPAAPQAATPAEVIPAIQSITVPLKFVSTALIATAKDDIRYYLNGVYFHAVDGEIRVCSTDGHRMLVSRYVPLKEERIPEWAERGMILDRADLAQVLPILAKRAESKEWGKCTGEPALIIDHRPGEKTVTVRSVIDFASFKLAPVDGRFPDYAKVLASAGASLVRNEADAMTTTAIDATYMRGAAEVAAKLGAKSINSFMGDGMTAAVFTFTGAPDSVLIIMPLRQPGEAVPDGVVKMLGSAGVSGSIGALRAHLTRTTKALESAKDDRERQALENRRSGFEARIAHLMAITTEGPKQLEHREAA